MKFSERLGFIPARKIVQIDSMDPGLRNRLWNGLASQCWREPRQREYLTDVSNRDLATFFPIMWHSHFKIPLDTIPTFASDAIGEIRKRYFESKWYEVYDLLEFTANHHPSENTKSSLILQSNAVLEEELSAYRFVSGKLIKITGEQEISAIERAISQTSSLFPHSDEHLQQAINLLALKPRPDLRNSIKESISAVEALCAAVTGNSGATLGQALKVIGPDLHSALLSAFDKLYGYTSDADGIRHALMEEEHLELEDAVFMLVSCSAFVSYVIAKQARRKPLSIMLSN